MTQKNIINAKEGIPKAPPKQGKLMESGPAGKATNGHFAFARLYALVGAICKTRVRENPFSEAAYSDASGRKPIDRKLEFLFSGNCPSAKLFRRMQAEPSEAPSGTYIDQINEASGIIDALTRGDASMRMVADVAGRANAASVSQAVRNLLPIMDILRVETHLDAGSPMSFRPNQPAQAGAGA